MMYIISIDYCYNFIFHFSATNARMFRILFLQRPPVEKVVAFTVEQEDSKGWLSFLDVHRYRAF